jgi:chaperonin GroEL (HSP60 family)
MNHLSDICKDLAPINKALESCYGLTGKCALIQSSASNSFTFTNGGETIINSLHFSHDKAVLRSVIEVINKHTSNYGDNSKTLFFYLNEMLESLNRLGTSNSDQWNCSSSFLLYTQKKT